MSDTIRIRVEGGYIEATYYKGPDFPGILVSFIGDNAEEEGVVGDPALLIEQPDNFADGEVRIIIWGDPKNEDYTEMIEFKKTTLSTSGPTKGRKLAFCLGNEIKNFVRGGYLKASVSKDPNYPGIWAEFIADDETDRLASRPSFLLMQPQGYSYQEVYTHGYVRALIWTNPEEENCTEEIEFWATETRRK